MTPQEGLELTVSTRLRDKNARKSPINPGNYPSIVVDDLRSAKFAQHVPNHQASLLNESPGFLAHEDVKAMRHAQVTVLLGMEELDTYRDGDRIRLISDGRNFELRKVERTKVRK